IEIRRLAIGHRSTKTRLEVVKGNVDPIYRDGEFGRRQHMRRAERRTDIVVSDPKAGHPEHTGIVNERRHANDCKRPDPDSISGIELIFAKAISEPEVDGRGSQCTKASCGKR